MYPYHNGSNGHSLLSLFPLCIWSVINPAEHCLLKAFIKFFSQFLLQNLSPVSDPKDYNSFLAGILEPCILDPHKYVFNIHSRFMVEN